MTKKLSVLVLAAGQGTRMKSKVSKVLHLVAGKPLLFHALQAARVFKSGGLGVVVGHHAEQVALAARSLEPRALVFRQRRLLGSGDAARQAAPWLKVQGGDVLVLCGDSPLLRSSTLTALLSVHRIQGYGATVLTAHVPNPKGYGRIVRSSDGGVDRIVEERDATPEIHEICEINTGVYCFDVKALLGSLPELRANNAKGEFYLTDVIAVLKGKGHSVGAWTCTDPEEALGVNSRQDLARAERILRGRLLNHWMDEGVTFLDPENTTVEAGVKIGSDTVVYPGTHLMGQTTIGADCRVGPFACIRDCVLGDRVEFVASFAKGARIGTGVRVGPFSHLREGTVVASGAHIGNFSEIKKSHLGKGSKVNHLSYVGDATVGEKVNIGAGTITCNYDGHQKHRTVIGSGSFIGSNVNLVAPVAVGKGVVVGAGSTITKSIPAGALALERGQQIIKKGWARKRQSDLESRAKSGGRTSQREG